MNKAILPIVALACLAIGGVVGFLIGQPGESPRHNLPELAERETVLPLPAKPETQPEVRMPEQVEFTAVPEDLRADLGAAIAAVVTEPAPTGDGRITGRVATPQGDPVPGVAIKAVMIMQTTRRTTNDPTLEEEVEAFIRRRKTQLAASRHTVTDADGNYAVESLDPSQQYTLNASLDGYIVERSGSSISRPGEVVNFTAMPALIVDVVLLLPNGSIAPDGQITCVRSDAGGRGSSFTSSPYAAPSARITLAPGNWTFTGRHGQDGAFTGELQVELKDGEPPRRLEIRLEGKGAIIGSLVVPELYVGQRFQVSLQKDPPSAEPEKRLNTRNLVNTSVHPRMTTTAFTFTELEPGAYRVLATVNLGFGPGGEPATVLTWADVSLGTERASVELRVPEPPRADFIIVRAFSPQGEQLKDLAVGLTIRSHNSGSSGGEQILRSPDGALWVRRMQPEERPGSSYGDNWWYVVKVTSRQYGEKEARYERNDTHDLEIRYIDPAHVELTVAGWVEAELRSQMRWSIVAPEAPGDTISLRSRRWENQPEPEPQPILKFGPMEPGEYDLVLMLSLEGDSFRDSVRQLYRRRITLGAGMNVLSAAVPPFNSVTIFVPEHVQAHNLSIWPEGQRSIAGRRSDNIHLNLRDRRATITHLAPGMYRLQSPEGEMEFRVPAGGEVVFEPRQYNAMLLNNIQPGGRLEALGLRDGDLLIAIDGQEITGGAAGMTLFNGALIKSQTTWTLIRNGVQMQVTFDGTELQRIANESDADKRERIWTSATYR
jgi:hypothetical protein